MSKIINWSKQQNDLLILEQKTTELYNKYRQNYTTRGILSNQEISSTTSQDMPVPMGVSNIFNNCIVTINYCGSSLNNESVGTETAEDSDPTAFSCFALAADGSKMVAAGDNELILGTFSRVYSNWKFIKLRPDDNASVSHIWTSIAISTRGRIVVCDSKNNIYYSRGDSTAWVGFTYTNQNKANDFFTSVAISSDNNIGYAVTSGGKVFYCNIGKLDKIWNGIFPPLINSCSCVATNSDGSIVTIAGIYNDIPIIYYSRNNGQWVPLTITNVPQPKDYYFTSIALSASGNSLVAGADSTRKYSSDGAGVYFGNISASNTLQNFTPGERTNAVAINGNGNYVYVSNAPEQEGIYGATIGGSEFILIKFPPNNLYSAVASNMDSSYLYAMTGKQIWSFNNGQPILIYQG